MPTGKEIQLLPPPDKTFSNAMFLINKTGMLVSMLRFHFYLRSQTFSFSQSNIPWPCANFRIYTCHRPFLADCDHFRIGLKNQRKGTSNQIWRANAFIGKKKKKSEFRSSSAQSNSDYRCFCFFSNFKNLHPLKIHAGIRFTLKGLLGLLVRNTFSPVILLP